MRLPLLIGLVASWPPVVAATFIVSMSTGGALALSAFAAVHTAVVLAAVIRYLASREIPRVDV